MPLIQYSFGQLLHLPDEQRADAIFAALHADLCAVIDAHPVLTPINGATATARECGDTMAFASTTGGVMVTLRTPHDRS
jgi:hypothetical protein